jgi:hypothetical protein
MSFLPSSNVISSMTSVCVSPLLSSFPHSIIPAEPKLGREIAEGSKGQMPNYPNLAMIISGFIALYHTCEKKTWSQPSLDYLP